MNVVSKYDRIYSREDPFGRKPERIVEDVLKFKNSGRVLDLGAGQGRNSLFLLEKGFEVTAVDLSSVGMGKIRGDALKRGLPIKARIGNAVNVGFSNPYDVVLLLFVLHHLQDDEAKALIEKAKSGTARDGLHIIAAFTRIGDFYEVNPNSGRFYPESGQLKGIYSDWEILKWYERTTTAYQKFKSGRPMRNKTSFLIARKSNT